MMLSLRDGLLLAFANLASHGIAARPALEATRNEGHAALAGELLLLHPNGLGSYVFWTDEDDKLLGPERDGTGALELHCSDLPTLRAVEGACRLAGLECRPNDGTRPPSVEVRSAPRIREIHRASAARTAR